MFRYIAGNSIKHVLKSSNNVILTNKIPIINYMIEESNNKSKIFNEHKNLIKSWIQKIKLR